MGNVRDNIPAQIRKPLNQESGAAEAINIRIAINGHPLAAQQGTMDPGHRPIHIGQEEGVSQEMLVGVEERGGLDRAANASIIK
jgi:hypothetical protein